MTSTNSNLRGRSQETSLGRRSRGTIRDLPEAARVLPERLNAGHGDQCGGKPGIRDERRSRSRTRLRSEVPSRRGGCGMRPRARDGRWGTRFGSWVASVTVATITRELQKDPALAVRPSEVYLWLAGKVLPRSPRSLVLVRLSHGALTLDDVYRHRVAAGARPLDGEADRAVWAAPTRGGGCRGAKGRPRRCRPGRRYCAVRRRFEARRVGRDGTVDGTVTVSAVSEARK